MSSIRTETETVIKRILPYLRRRGYAPEIDVDFETGIKSTTRYGRGYVDLLVTAGKSSPQFLIEAKRSGKRLTEADRRQALDYGTATKVLFVIVTNGDDIRAYNAKNGQPIRWDGKLIPKIPTKTQLAKVVGHLKANRESTDVPLSGDTSLPFRPGLPLKQLNELFRKAHNTIRNIEKNEESAFADFSKLLFLKLLEEKADLDPDYKLPYSYRFFELAEKPVAEADQVKTAVLSMLRDIVKLGYGDVLLEPIKLKQSRTFHSIVQRLSQVSFEDSGLDSKGVAFEYFVRATLKGRRLGQYFTPRPLVDLMLGMVGRTSVVESLRAGEAVRVLDPACGTGGFLVFAMKQSLAHIDSLVEQKKITKAAGDTLSSRIRTEVFFGVDANESVAATAKMNMIIAGDGHTNISPEDSLAADCRAWSFDSEGYDLILTNPPFGTSVGESLGPADLSRYPLPSGRGQYLFLQRMLLACKPGGYVATVIDEGLLNTDAGAELRRWALQQAELLAVVRLPDETFKPNKINVRSSVLVLRKREQEDLDLTEVNQVAFCELASLGYRGSGEAIRGFDFDRLRRELEESLFDQSVQVRDGYYWRAFNVSSSDIAADGTCRWDLKYWEPGTLALVARLQKSGARTVASLNTIDTGRGKSPAAATYVDESDGYALVVKAGSCITRFGTLAIPEDADYIEKNQYDDMVGRAKLIRGDVLLASTGDGTLGKACVFDLDTPAVADGHVTIIRVDSSEVEPAYLADYLRCGEGAEQIQRLFTGSTGLIELAPEQVDRILVSLPDLEMQRELSRRLRESELNYLNVLTGSEGDLRAAREQFADSGA